MPRSKFRRIVDTLIDGVIIINGSGTILRANPAIKAILGYAEEELLGKNVSTLMLREDRDRRDSCIERYRETGNAQVIGIGREVDAGTRMYDCADRTGGDSGIRQCDQRRSLHP